MHPIILRHLEALKLEAEHERAEFREQVLHTPLEVRQKAGRTWYPVELEEESFSPEGHLRLTVRRADDRLPSSFDAGQAAALFVNLARPGKPNPLVQGVITQANNLQLTIQLGVEDLPEAFYDGRWGVDAYFDETTVRLTDEATRRAGTAHNSRLAELRDVLLGDLEPRLGPAIPFDHPRLNPSQNAAVALCLRSLDVAAIHGPPGTGKTTTLVQLLVAVLKAEGQALVCAPSNTAVDDLATKLTDAGVAVLRVGSAARAGEAVQRLTLDRQLATHPDYDRVRKFKKEAVAMRRQAAKFRRTYARGEREAQFQQARLLLQAARDLEKHVVTQTLARIQVFVGTPVALASAPFLQHRTFGTVFIDEAAQLLGPMAWLVVEKAHRVVLAGDPLQLPPTVKSREAQRLGLGQSLMEVFLEHTPQPAAHSVLLNEQHRMHAAIMAYPNHKLYGGQLRAHPSVAGAVLSDRSTHPTLTLPIEWIDTAGAGYDEHFDPAAASFGNPAEARFVLNHLAELAAAWHQLHPALPLTAGIIAPYKHQVRILQGACRRHPGLASHPNLHISIDTVDGFQGQERDVVYISLTRSNPEGQIGFLTELRRMNVAITRARRKLVLIGDSATAGCHPFYAELIAFIEGQHGYSTIWEWPEALAD
jgi:superfamily I DNA and/or RNA helicase